MAIRMIKPFEPLTLEAIDRLPAQLGVYEIAGADGQILYIGYAGGLEPFGLQTALRREVERPRVADRQLMFRLEYTSGYLTRWEELLMVHLADHGSLPAANADQTDKIGRLSPA